LANRGKSTAVEAVEGVGNALNESANLPPVVICSGSPMSGSLDHESWQREKGSGMRPASYTLLPRFPSFQLNQFAEPEVKSKVFILTN
jgi:hypothetical protein